MHLLAFKLDVGASLFILLLCLVGEVAEFDVEAFVVVEGARDVWILRKQGRPEIIVPKRIRHREFAAQELDTDFVWIAARKVRPHRGHRRRGQGDRRAVVEELPFGRWVWLGEALAISRSDPCSPWLW